jgi:hypothetical protein
VKPRPTKFEPHKIASADVWADQTRTACAKAIVTWLKGSLNVDRPIRSLKLAEVECMAEAATSTFLVEASKRMYAVPPPPDAAELQLLLA